MAPQNSSPSALQGHLKRLWIHGFLAGFGVVFVILLICLFIWGWPSTSQEGPEEAAKPASSQAPAAPAAPPASVTKTPAPGFEAKPSAALESELSAVLAKLGEANQKKDLHQLMDLYSPTFPDLQQKIQGISRSWAAYDYLSLNFKLAEIACPAPDSAAARVTWGARARQRKTREVKNTTKTYLVWFTRNSGQWRIQSLEKVEKASSRDKSS